MKTKLIFLLFFSVTPLLWAKKLLFANCEMGSGCIFYISEMSPEDAYIVDGDKSLLNLPEDAIHVNVKKGNKYYRYYERNKTRSQLDRFYGGDGYTMIYPFNPNFQPRSGKWKQQFGTVQGNTCYGQSTNLLKSALNGKLFSGNVEFPEPFYPEFLMNSKDIKWYNISPNSYRGVFGKDMMNMVYDVKIKNELEIEGSFTVTIKIPTKPVCINKVPFKMICVQPKPKKMPKEAWVDWVDIPIDLGLGKEKVKTNVPRIEDEPKTHVPRIEDEPKTHVPRIEDEPRTHVPRVDEE
jgi:hypothetical protein